MTCTICGNTSGNTTLIAAEMMFGFRDAFTYIRCGSCGCLVLRDPPANLDKYYPRDYYSFRAVLSDGPREPWHKLTLKAFRSRHFAGRPTLLGRVLARGVKEPDFFEWLHPAGILPHHRIVDVGCGNGVLLLRMYREGYRHLHGIDAFVDRDIEYPCGVRIVKGTSDRLEGSFDFAMLHHSFEHMTEPVRVLAGVSAHVSPHGWILVRLPNADSCAFREYGAHWAQLDAPRHAILHTPKSIEIVARAAGLSVERAVYDSNEFQFWGSEQYRQGIALNDPRSYAVAPGKSLFSPETMAGFQARARELNETGDGDSVCFWLRKAGTSAPLSARQQ
jgi:SAM-dependent methyltransferase